MNTLSKYRLYTVLWEILFVFMVLLGLVLVLFGCVLLIASFASIFADATSDPSIRIIMVLGVILPVSLLIIFMGIILPLNFSVKLLASHYRVRLRKYEEYQAQHKTTGTLLASSGVTVRIERGATKGLFAWNIGVVTNNKLLSPKEAKKLPPRPESWSVRPSTPDPRYVQFMRKRADRLYLLFIILPVWLIIGIVIMTIKNNS